VAWLTAGSGVKSRAPAGIQFSVFPFGNKSLVGSIVLMESNAMAARIVRLGRITYLLHTPE